MELQKPLFYSFYLTIIPSLYFFSFPPSVMKCYQKGILMENDKEMTIIFCSHNVLIRAWYNTDTDCAE